MAFAACSSSGGDTDAVRYGLDFGPNLTETFNPQTSLSTCDRIVLQWIYDTLTILDEGGDPQPGLAESWENNGDTFVLNIREGVSFSDGTPFDAEAVAAGLNYLSVGEQTADDFRDVESIEATGDLTVEFTMEEPTAFTIPYALATRAGMIPAPSTYENEEDPSAEGTPIGAGPFILDSFEPGSRIGLVANDDYAGPRTYEIPALDFVQVGVGVPAVNALRGGELDVITFESESLETIEDDPDISFDSRLGEVYAQIQLRLTEGSPLTDVRVRQAMNHAIDREEFNDVVLAGTGTPAWMPYPEGHLAYNAEAAEQYPYDPDRARELLTEAGFPDGFEFDMAIPGGNVGQERQGEFLQQQLADVGITVNIVPLAEIATEYYIQKTGEAFSAARPASADPTGQLFDQWGNFQFVAIHNFQENDAITALVQEARTQTDTAEVSSLMQQATAIVVEEALEVPLAFQPRNVAWDNQRLEGDIGAPAEICDPVDLTGVTLK